MNKPIPTYLNEKSNIVKLIIFTSAFALVFINIYTPFGSEYWYDISKIRFFIFSSLIILTGILVVVISRIIMFYRSKRRHLLLWQYMVWIAAEIFFMSLFYTLYSLSVDASKDLMETFHRSVKNTSLVLLLPYSVSWLYLSWIDKSRKLQQLEEGGISEQKTPKMIPFKDEKGELKLTVDSEHLLYLEAADNYINVIYLNKGKIFSFMIRNSLKNLESSLSPQHKILARCHRSYMINVEKVKVMRREKGSVWVELDGENVKDIPVSKTYIAQLTPLLF